MRAVVLREFGPPERLALAEVPDPVPGPGQVLIDVRISNITFVETQVRAGRAPNPAMAPRLPAILGNGVGGLIDGQQVVSTTGGSGGYAERAVADASWPIPVPAGLDLADAVAVLADGRTALALTRAADVRAGETVLVEAAAGGVGSLLVQLAHGAGARVVAAAGGTRKAAFAAGLGADLAVDYSAPDWADEVAAFTSAGAASGIDVIFDGVGGAIGQAAFGLLRPGGRFYAYGLASGTFTAITDDEAARRGITVLRGAPVTPQQMRELSVAALAEAAAGRLRPVIGQTFPLERAADAHAAIERRETIGKTLLLT
jgi:NADPH:quinone reductase